MQRKDIEQIFSEALELPVGQRASFLTAQCGGDTGLRQKVESLLKVSGKAEGFLEDTSIGESFHLGDALLQSRHMDELPGDWIGRYKLLERLGEGGWGVVWMAEQEKPIRRRVALKILKIGMDTKEFIGRFESERQALAIMEHPNIARIFDGGATEKGRPYFVMELVRGIRITDYCDQEQLTTQARLQLFIKVCHAVQHAHQKGIIHRDLKPSNILVTVNDGEPVPKVIDFGVAKAMDYRLSDTTFFTRFQSFVGTPAYTSPEQAEMSSGEVDARSDVYSLGALLYELLSGRTPFDPEELAKAGFSTIRKIICETEPPLPSVQLHSLSEADRTTLALRRGTEVERLPRVLRGDLDWITMKCLEKNRSRRYQSASKLAEDLTAFLENRPVSAAAPSSVYRIRKFLARTRPAYAVWLEVSLVLVVLLAMVVYFRPGSTPSPPSPVAVEFTAPSIHQKLQAGSEGKLANSMSSSDLAYDLYIKCINIEKTEGDTEASILLRRDMLEQAVLEDPNFVEAWARLKRMYDKMAGRVASSGSYLADGQAPDVVRLGFLEKSRQAMARALALDPENPQALLASATDDVWPKSPERMQEVKEIFDRVIEQNPEDFRAWYHLGWWYWHSSPRDPVNAFKAWEEALNRDPWNVRIIRKLVDQYGNIYDQVNKARMEELLARVTPRAEQNRLLEGVPSWKRQETIQSAFLETADEALLDQYERVWRESLRENSPALLDDANEMYLRVFTSDLDRILALASKITFHEKLDLADTGFIQKTWGLSLASWGDFSFNIQYGALCVHCFRGQQSEAETIARQIIKVAQIRGVSENLVSNAWFVRTLTAAHAVLGDEAEAGELAKGLVNLRSKVFDVDGYNGIRAMGWVDPDRAAEIVLTELSKNPDWPPLDMFAAFYLLNYQVIDHPKVVEYLLKEGKWIDYLAQRSPAYAKSAKE